MNELRHSRQMSNRCKLGGGHEAGLTDSMNKSEQETTACLLACCSLFSPAPAADCNCAATHGMDDVEGCRCN